MFNIMKHHLAISSDFFNNMSLISHLEVQYIYVLFIFFPIAHILMSCMRTDSHFVGFIPSSQIVKAQFTCSCNESLSV